MFLFCTLRNDHFLTSKAQKCCSSKSSLQLNLHSQKIQETILRESLYVGRKTFPPFFPRKPGYLPRPFHFEGSGSFVSRLCSLFVPQLKYAKWPFSLSSLKCAIHSNMGGNCPQLATKKKGAKPEVVEQGGKEGINYANNTKDFSTWKPNFPIISTLSLNISPPTTSY